MSGRRSLGIAVSVVMAVAVGAGLWVNGTPMHQRRLAQDTMRERALTNLATRIDFYGDKHKVVPATLAEIAPAAGDRMDPVTQVPFTYEGHAREYTLCATFEAAGMEAPPTSGERFAQHPQGRACFHRSLDGADDAPTPYTGEGDP
ncbi:hypothetical protein KPL74_03125 [Bacillus sp. NP157]|nr:hypothetical protein KPL74_03125 [Bacillus sp. NP157]